MGRAGRRSLVGRWMIRASAVILGVGPALAESPAAPLQSAIPACFHAAEDEVAAHACVGTESAACMQTPDGQTTVGMMTCLLAENEVWDGLLNAEYAAARARAAEADAAEQASFPEFAVRAAQVRDAQRAWIAFRDANCAMEYGVWGAGSMRQIAGADCLLRMTSERTIELASYRRSLGDE